MIVETLSIVGRSLLWQSAVLAVIVFLVLYLLPHGQISARYRVALSGLFGAGLLLAIPFLPSISLGLEFAPEIFQSTNDLMSIVAPIEAYAPSFAPSEITLISNQAGRPLGLIFTFIWLTGSCAALFRLGFAVWQGRALSRGFSPMQLNGASILSRPVSVVRSHDVSAPLVFGFLKPVIVVPENFSLDLKNPETRVVLEHEIAHIVRGDLWVNLAQRLVLALLWWCLPLYWINRQIGAERENLCDALATAHVKRALPSGENPARMLAGALVRYAEQRPNNNIPSLAIGIHPKIRPGAKLLARRIQLLCDSNPVPHLSKKLLFTSTLAVPMALFMLSMITPRAFAGNPQTSETKNIISLQKTTGHRVETRTKETAPHANIVTGRLTSKYGASRKHFNNKAHNGIDIANIIGTPIYAPADALVIEVTNAYKNNAKWGKVVVIETQGGVRTVFAHLDGYSVSPGQTIKAGTQIGRVGNTGFSTGPHVHIATLIDGQYVDPITVWPKLQNELTSLKK